MEENRDINQELIDLINASTPANTSAAHILCDILNIHRESAYRRIRGDVKLNFDEVVKIQEVLNLPLEQIFKKSKQDTLALEADLVVNNPQQKDSYCDSICKLLASKHANAEYCYRVLNRIPFNFIFKHELLSRFDYYKWLSKKYTPFEYEYLLSSPTPEHIRERQLQIIDYYESCPTTYIFSEDIFESYCKEMKHFRLLGYITDDEFVRMQDELRLVVDEISELCLKEQFSSGKKVDIYIASIDIHAAFTYLKSKESNVESNEMSIHSIYGTTSYLVSTSKNLVDMTKVRYHQLIKLSTLITQSGAKYSFPYLQKQRERIDLM